MIGRGGLTVDFQYSAMVGRAQNARQGRKLNAADGYVIVWMRNILESGESMRHIGDSGLRANGHRRRQKAAGAVGGNGAWII